MLRNKLNILHTILFVLLIIIIMSNSVIAGDNPLNLESAYPENGAKNIPIDLKEIKLTFSNNVVNMKVSENNMKCFEILEANGDIVPIDVIMADDQIEREKRNDILLVPKNPLKEDSTYIIKINENLTGKNGIKLGETIEIQFSTISSRSGVIYLWIGILLVLIIGGYYIFRKYKK